jgi:hypothetical protein
MGIPCGLRVVVLLNIAPAVVLFIDLRWAGMDMLLCVLIGFVFYFVIAVLLLLHNVSRLDLDADGIHFVRRLGWPRFVPWSEINDISPVLRREVFLHAWLWPLWPQRDSTASLTALGHYRISFGHYVRYFPPKQPEEFFMHVREFSQAAQNRRGINLDPLPELKEPSPRSLSRSKGVLGH